MKFGLFARPHLKSSPPGEEITFVRFWFCGRPFGKSSRWFFQRRGEHVSLSANKVGGEGWGDVACDFVFAGNVTTSKGIALKQDDFCC
jgi:hypothetical protein